jgi:hypothetical protein
VSAWLAAVNIDAAARRRRRCMVVDLPHPKQVWNAIEAYLRCAYESTSPPPAVQKRLETLRAAGENGGFFASGVFERDSSSKKYSLRLGNRFYPHMKLSIDERPDQRGFFFRADTHDRHICPQPASKEFAAFRELMEKNQEVAQSIESAWQDGGLPTFKTFLKQDLARRQQSARNH